MATLRDLEIKQENLQCEINDVKKEVNNTISDNEPTFSDEDFDTE